MATAIATVGGVAVAPGVSRNGRLYTKRAIAGMVARVQDKIASGNSPVLVERDDPVTGHVITQLTHHAAEDDSTRIVGRVTGMSLDESGRARFTADIAPTPAGKTVAALLDTSDGKPPFLRGVSGRMAWLSGARVERHEGQVVETGDELDLMGLDYTHKPGIPDAAVDTFRWTEGGTKNETTERVLIYESVMEALVAPISEPVTEAVATEPAAPAIRLPEEPHILENGWCVTCNEASKPLSKRGSGLSDASGKTYADPGYQADKKQRYDLSTKANAKAAWSYINMPKNAKLYSGPQLKRVKARIRAALAKFGIKTAAEGWCIEPAVLLTETVSEAVLEHYGMGDQSGSYCVTACNGPTTVTVSSYCCDPADLDVILRAATDGACQALQALDPDMDGDIDVAGGDDDTDDDMGGESLPDVPAGTMSGETTDHPAAAAGEADEAALAESEGTPAPEAAAGETTERSSAMPETTPAAESAPAAATGLSQADIDAAVARALDADRAARKARKDAKRAGRTESAPAAPVAESAPAAPAAATESEAAMVERLVAAKLSEQFPAETDEQRIQRLVQESYDAEYARRVQAGQINPGRKGLIVSEAAARGAAIAPDQLDGDARFNGKPLHELSQDDFDRLTGPVVVGHVLGARSGMIG